MLRKLDQEGWVKRFIEKPESMENNLVVVGCYYFKSADKLLAAIEEQMERNLTLKGEFFLTDTISLMIEKGAKVRTQNGESWLDTGTIEATLETNKILLEQGKANRTEERNRWMAWKSLPRRLFIPAAEIRNSVIGPYASIGANCKISNSRIEESIVEADCEIKDAALSRSLIGIQASVTWKDRRSGQVMPIERWRQQFDSLHSSEWIPSNVARIQSTQSARFR